MKRLGLVLVCVAILVVFLARGDEQKSDPEEATPTRRMPIPIPGPPPANPADEARGIYMLESGETRIALDLQAERKFRSLAKFPGQEPRETTGTWSLAGRNLTLTYRYVGGEPIEGGPKFENCVYRGTKIELKIPGRSKPVVLQKAAVIRHK